MKSKLHATSLRTAFLIVLIISISGCMKTRAQLRGDTAESETEEARPTKGRYEMEELRNEFTRVSGKLEELEHAQKNQNYTELKEYVTRLDGRIAELEKNQLLMLTEIKELKDKKVEEEKEAATSPKDHLVNGNQLLADGKCEEASQSFASVIKKAKGKEAAEAHFGAGEAHFCMKDYKKAIVEYSKVQDINPKSSKVPASLYRIALSFKKLNMHKEAEGFFAELAEKFPKSPEGKKARAKIKE